MPYKDPERRRSYGRAWMKRNPEKAREAMRRWRARHPEAHKAELRRRYLKDPQRRNEVTNASPNRNAVRRAMRQRRRARLAAAGGSFSYREWLDLVAARGGRCAYCGAEGPLEADHRVPLARGGANTIENILPACGPCNRRKHKRTEAEYRAWLERTERR